jgi:hypothetical protein
MYRIVKAGGQRRQGAVQCREAAGTDGKGRRGSVLGPVDGLDALAPLDGGDDEL